MTSGFDETFGMINQVLYGIDFTPDLAAESAVEAHVDKLIAQRVYLHPPEEYAAAIALSLRAGRLPSRSVASSDRFSERELLDYLARLAARLEERLAYLPHKT
jgi:hypothetical protein